MTPLFDGTIKEGKLLLDKDPKFREYLSTLNGKRVQVTVEKIKNSRTISQNRYYWGVVVKLIAQYTGHDPEQIRELLKGMWAPRWHFPAPTGAGIVDLTFPTSTTRLDTIEFVEYTEKCRLWANEFLGLEIPLPGEVTV